MGRRGWNRPAHQRAHAPRTGQDNRTTTQRGYGWDHQQARAQALAALQPGTPCPFCGDGMDRAMKLDYDHYPPLALGPGLARTRRLAHASCNRRAGQALAHPTSTVVNSRVW